MMSRRIQLTVLAAAALLFSACGGSIIPEVSPELVAAAQARGIDPALLAEGRAQYVRDCSGCHALHAPARKSAAGWRKALDEMSVKAKLDARRRQLIENYLAAASDAAAAQSAAQAASPSSSKSAVQ